MSPQSGVAHTLLAFASRYVRPGLAAYLRSSFRWTAPTHNSAARAKPSGGSAASKPARWSRASRHPFVVHPEWQYDPHSVVEPGTSWHIRRHRGGRPTSEVAGQRVTQPFDADASRRATLDLQKWAERPGFGSCLSKGTTR